MAEPRVLQTAGGAAVVDMSTPTFRYSAASRGVIQTAGFEVGSAGFIMRLLAPRVGRERADVCCATDTAGVE